MGEKISIPPGDQELPLSEHLRELRNRIVIVLAVTIFLMVLAYPVSGNLMETVWTHIMPPYVKMTVYEPMELIKVRIIVSFIAAVTIGFPLLVYETFKFMAPGLYRNEKRFILAVFPFSLALFVAGALVAYFITLPLFFDMILSSGSAIASPELSMKETFTIVTNFMVGFGVVFQVPLVILMSIKMDIVKRKTLANGRLAVYGILFAFAVLVSPDPTMLSQLIVGIVLIILFEMSMFLAKFI
ncbi:twin-arginine translocase subunit TatC [Methanocella sp. CWC-04]|uniref:Sec-independent protein translocase protein TatC n=1 Tax=Methanooceanicella nereidis TaxID=2052831 RepID=A0AAP2W8K3_9EURY|nr:twin-arginine translocase subunit TatC [Methanocella sp. CWC-04]MCD1296279.1 twin-arginine translocase subunit TatC [Methanocella sp. CWC-04]